MRWLVMMVALVAAGCESGTGGGACRYEGRIYDVGDRFPAGDDCNTCTCLQGGDVACTEIACLGDAGPGPDADPDSCLRGEGCLAGPACGAGCCGPGEVCVNGLCQCGDSAACVDGDSCEALGPVGADGCGAVCCGVSGPCPQ